MFNRSRYRQRASSLDQLAQQIVNLEFVWSFPLIAVGVLKVQKPVWVGLAVFLAVLPWLVRWFILGQSLRRPFVGGALGLLAVSGLVGVWASYDPELSWPLFFTLLGSVNLFFTMSNVDFYYLCKTFC